MKRYLKMSAELPSWLVKSSSYSYLWGPLQGCLNWGTQVSWAVTSGQSCAEREPFGARLGHGPLSCTSWDRSHQMRNC